MLNAVINKSVSMLIYIGWNRYQNANFATHTEVRMLDDTLCYDLPGYHGNDWSRDEASQATSVIWWRI